MPEPQAPEQPTLAAAIGRAAGTICSDGFPTGDRAKLRRMAPGQPLPLVFTRFALAHLPEGWERQPDDWAALLAGIAIMAPHAHRPRHGLGRALAEAGYSEARLERLLDADGETRRTLLLRAVRFLAAKGAPFDWHDAAQLLLTRDDSKRDRINQRMALDFFSNLKSESSAA
jgi:CRISPR system Cascade subunit CasB